MVKARLWLFSTVALLLMTLGGPAQTTTTLSYYIYTKAFEEFQIGYASSVAWVLFVLVFAVTMLNWRYGSRYVNE